MRRTTIAGLIAGLALAASPVVAGPAAAGSTSASATTASAGAAAVAPAAPARAQARHGWSTVFKKAGAKVQACRHNRAGFHGVEVRLDARDARRRVKARSRIEHVEAGAWVRVPGQSSQWRRRGVERFDSFISGVPHQIRLQARIRTSTTISPYTGWVDAAGLRRCR